MCREQIFLFHPFRDEGVDLLAKADSFQKRHQQLQKHLEAKRAEVELGIVHWEDILHQVKPHRAHRVALVCNDCSFVRMLS